MSVGHLYVFFGKMSIQIICPFFSRVVCVVFFFDVEMYELLHILDINPLSDTSFANIFSNSVGSHFNRCEVISHCGFDLHFPDD